MSADGELDRVVHQYLQQRNYKQASKALEEESPVVSLGEATSLAARKIQADSAVANQVAAIARSGDGSGAGAAEQLEEHYKSLNTWIETSLDQYRSELYTVMYPIFVHCYLDLVARGQAAEAKKFVENHAVEHEQYHKRELEELKAVTTIDHMAKNAFVNQFRRQKYNLVLCSYSFELLLAYVQEQKFMTILSIINQHLDIKVFSGKPKQKYEAFGMAGTTMSTELAELNAKDILWGSMRLNEVEEALNDDDDDEDLTSKTEPGAEEVGPDAARARKRAKRRHLATVAQGPKQGRIPLPELRGRSLQMQLDQLKEMRQRVDLGRNALPSACMYTFFNTAERLHNLTLSRDKTMISGGFADSYVKVWDLTKKGLKSLKSAEELGEIDIDASTKMEDLLDDSSAEEVKTLIGHTGPVYSTSFSPDNSFLLSGSEDGTARLWDLHTFTNVVAYKGHMYPVWGTAFSPLGYYFATASHDRTARLWSTDHIFPLRIFAGHLSDVNTVAFHPNSNYVATGSSDRSCRLWDVQTGDCVRVFEGHSDSIHALAFTDDGHYMASGGDDCNVVLWDLGSGKKVKTFKGHTDVVHSVAFSGEGSLIASGAADNTVRIWDAVTDVGETTETAGGTGVAGDASTGVDPSEYGFELAVFATKDTPVFTTAFTNKNLLLCGGPLVHSESEQQGDD
eukprot:m.196804 g.196804  ORF g.196804 m.196804 type:complete len:680 (+) comp19909_c0_seq1:100-2139(+)